MHDLVNPGMKIPNWITIIKDVKVRKEQHDVKSLFKRIGKTKNATDINTFVLIIPTGMEHTILKIEHHIAEAYFVCSFKQRKKNPLDSWL